MSWFDLFTNNSNLNTRNGTLGYLAPSEYIDFNESNITGSPVIGQIGNGSSNSWFSGDSFLSGDKGGGLEGLGGIGGVTNILAGLGNIWNGFNQQKLAKKALNFQKDAFNRTFANNNKVYNQNMEDVLKARSAQTGQDYSKLIAERRL